MPNCRTHILGIIGGIELHGKERGNLEALAAMQSNGAEITVGISSRVPDGGQVGPEARARGYATMEFHLGSHFKRSWMKNPAYAKVQLQKLIKNGKQIIQVIRSQRPNHILFGAHDVFIFFAFGLLFARTSVIFRCGDEPPKGSRFHMFIWRWLVRRSTHVVAISHFIEQEIIQAYPKAKGKITVIHNIAPARSGAPSSLEMSRLKATKKKRQLVYVGQLVPEKGLDPLLEAIIQLNDSDLGCWVVGGSGFKQNQALESEWKQRTQECHSASTIEWLGFQPDPRPYFAAADWHIAPSICNEAFGNVVREAQSMGTPSIVSPNGGLPETLLDGSQGIVLDEISVESIISGIGRAFEMDADSITIAVKTYSDEVNSDARFQTQWKAIIQ